MSVELRPCTSHLVGGAQQNVNEAANKGRILLKATQDRVNCTAHGAGVAVLAQHCIESIQAELFGCVLQEHHFER